MKMKNNKAISNQELYPTFNISHNFHYHVNLRNINLKNEITEKSNFQNIIL